MKPYTILLGTFALAISGAIADNSSAPTVDTQALLAQLKALKTQSTTQTNGSLSQIIQQVQAAATSDISAVALYEQCEKINHFEGKNTAAGDFAALKRKQGPEFQNADTKFALRLRLTYLALSLEKAAGTSPKTLAPSVWDYIKQLYSNGDHIDFDFLASGEANTRGGGSRRQGSTIADSEVARGLQCASYLKNLKDWELNPSDGYAIFKNSLRPLLLAAKDPQISQYWDAMIDLASRSVAKTSLLSSAATFNTVQKPQMLWDRAQDIVAIGERNAGIAEMMQLIKSNTTHPNVGTWISTLETLLKNNTTASASPVAPAAPVSAPTPTPPLTTNAPANAQPTAAVTTSTPLPAATPQNYPPDVSILPGSSPTPAASASPANH